MHKHRYEPKKYHTNNKALHELYIKENSYVLHLLMTVTARYHVVTQRNILHNGNPNPETNCM